MSETESVLFDTDIGSDIDDAIALCYLLSQPRCRLLGITTVSGEVTQRARIASALCHAAGRPDLPIYPGLDRPLVVAQRQPRAHQAAYLGGLPHETTFPADEAIEFQRRTIRAHPGEVTLIATGPMTNVAALFQADPEVPRLLKRLVMMIGSYTVTGHRGLDADWNTLCDPHAAAIVFAAEVAEHWSTPLDVTLRLKMTAAEAGQRFDSGLLAIVRRLNAAELSRSQPVFFHDPLTAAVVFDEELCRFERGNVEVDLDRGTRWQADERGRHQVAFEVDEQRFFDRHLALIG